MGSGSNPTGAFPSLTTVSQPTLHGLLQVPECVIALLRDHHALSSWVGSNSQERSRPTLRSHTSHLAQ
jgi:hypothetical protein